ncbi:MAG: InlB B-repeat-containing protein, partial [Clostridia bacterium]|nr:InlB B-repeat-containing protein [Clostridia bacterium]
QDLMASVKGGAAMRNYTAPFKNATDVPHVYTVSLKEVPAAVQLGNKIKNTTDKMYMEYTVESEDSDICLYGFQLNGGAFGSNTQFIYTSEGAHALPCDLLTAGASYWLEFTNTHTASGWDVLIQRTISGKTEWFKINKVRLGTADENNNGYSALYFGEGGGMQVTAELKNLKIYDANHKNLGVQVNKECDITHDGEYETYENCESVFYCKKNDTTIVIYPDKTAKITRNGSTKDGTYSVEDGDPAVMTLKAGTETLTYNFTTTRLTDADGNIYQAIGSVKVTFVTGTDTEIPTQVLTAKSGYKATKPENPTYKDDEFVCWVTSDGKEFDFNSVVFESITLFAKWKNKAGVTYTALDTDTEKREIDFTPFIAIGATVLIAAATAVGFVIIIRRFKKQ